MPMNAPPDSAFRGPCERAPDSAAGHPPDANPVVAEILSFLLQMGRAMPAEIQAATDELGMGQAPDVGDGALLRAIMESAQAFSATLRATPSAGAWMTRAQMLQSVRSLFAALRAAPRPDIEAARVHFGSAPEEAFTDAEHAVAQAAHAAAVTICLGALTRLAARQGEPTPRPDA
ncbi:hypothetical protein JJL56_28100 [Azospirillum sp. YIM DDC1]|uniref:Uncharacterized protein n=1 Tax=Azospirillum aestuarii TaxID=2802052 RepID=A0ABS1I6N6_9PROT|nr:hypothetical protein [Azospirillum aestuarii]MBK4722724.1 hypothetical protein [Azospirillum aestuarii]